MSPPSLPDVCPVCAEQFATADPPGRARAAGIVTNQDGEIEHVNRRATAYTHSVGTDADEYAGWRFHHRDT